MSQTKAQLLDNIKDNVQLDAQKALRFADSDSSHYVALKAPATVSSSVTWTLPSADGSANYVLATNGSGTLSWIADPAGQWTTSGSNIYFTGGNVGIGDSSPSNPLSVTGVSAFNGDVTFTGASYNVTWDKSADDLIFNDNAKAAFGTGSDLTIYHDGTNSIINGALRFTSGDVYFRGSDTNNRGWTWDTSTEEIRIEDQVELCLGNAQDLKIYHDGSNSYIAESGTGSLYIKSSAQLYLQSYGGEDFLKADANGAVELYHNNVKKFETTSGGAKVTGDLQMGGTAGVKFSHTGTSSIYESQTAGDELLFKTTPSGGSSTTAITVSPIGDITLAGAAASVVWDKSEDDLLFPDNARAVFGTGSDLLIFHDGANSRVREAGTGNLRLEGGVVELWGDGSKQLNTFANGIQITGISSSGGIDVTADNTKLRIGASQDLLLYHDGSDNILSGPASNTAVTLKIQPQADEVSAVFKDTSVDLYFENGKKFETTSTGGNITSGANGTSKLHVGHQATRGLDIRIADTGGQVDATAILDAKDSESSNYHAQIQFHLGAAEKARFDGNGNYFRMASGTGGIQLNGDSAAANALHEYEEGTFSATFSGGLTGSSYGYNTGTYTKIGRAVYWTLIIYISSGQDTTNSNVINIDGFPFTCLNASPQQGGGGWPFYNDAFFDSTAGFSGIQIDNATQLRLYRADNGAYLTGSLVDGDRQIRMTGFYHATA